MHFGYSRTWESSTNIPASSQRISPTIFQYNIWLVVKPPLWKIWKSIGMIIPNIWENRKCSKPPTSIKFPIPFSHTFPIILEKTYSPSISPQNFQWHFGISLGISVLELPAASPPLTPADDGLLSNARFQQQDLRRSEWKRCEGNDWANNQELAES